MINIEKAEKKAQDFMTLANNLAKVIKKINTDAREGWEYVNADNYLEIITLSGDEVVACLRGLAMQLDRGALLKFDEAHP